MAYTKEQFNQKVKDLYPNIEVISDFTRIKDPISAKCLVCGHEWTLKQAGSLIKSGCSNCSKKQKGLNHRTKHDDFVNKLKSINPNVIPLGIYTRAKDKIQFKCNICGNIWEARPDSILRGSGCPKCAVVKVHNQQKLSEKEFLARVHNNHPHIKVLDKYTNSKLSLNCYCNIHNIKFISLAKTLMNGVFACPLCQREGSINRQQKPNDIFLKELQDRGLQIEPLEEYKGANTKIKVKCLKCGHIREVTPSNLLTHGEGCPGCLNRITCLEDMIKEANRIHNNKYDYSKSIYTGRHNKTTIICPIHGEFEQEIGSHLSGCGCPKCNSSKGELKIAEILDRLNILYIPQFKVKNKEYFPNHKQLEIDFQFVYNNKEYFIEYNGKQHYVPVEYFGGKIKFEHQQERDINLRKYCSNNNISLLEIPYTENLENIENIIKNFINYESIVN